MSFSPVGLGTAATSLCQCPRVWEGSRGLFPPVSSCYTHQEPVDSKAAHPLLPTLFPRPPQSPEAPLLPCACIFMGFWGMFEMSCHILWGRVIPCV